MRETLQELFSSSVKQKTSVDNILKAVSTVFQVKVQDLKGHSRSKELTLARQVAMYLAKSLISESLTDIGAAFGKTHSTVLYACKTVEHKISKDTALLSQIHLCKNHIVGQ